MKISNREDAISLFLMKTMAALVVAMLFCLILLLFKVSLPSIKSFGFQFIISSEWNPVEDKFGGLAFIFGTCLTSSLALLLAAPLSIGVALFINEILPQKIGNVLALFVEMIASIPSIVFGLWGLFYLSPWIKTIAAPWLKLHFGFLPFFTGPSFGIGFLTASLILAVMITPTITSVCREVFKSIPPLQKEAALALGATRYETLKIAVLAPSLSGIVGAIVLGFGRAVGETMAVAMVIGNSPTISASVFSPGATMASVIANEYPEASGLQISSLCYVGLLLFFITIIINGIARTIIWRGQNKWKRL
jgi:phosphate transport system permease protein